MANRLHIYTNNPTAGGVDGTEVSSGTGLSPITVSLDASKEETQAVKCALRCDTGFKIDGEVAVSVNEEVGQAMVNNPRTAIGIIDDNHYVFIVSDGRTSASTGLTLNELANFMTSLGVKIGYNLDGGGSSTMVFNGTVINQPTTNGKSISERKVSDIVYLG